MSERNVNRRNAGPAGKGPKKRQGNPANTKKSKRRWIWILIPLILLLAIAAVGAFLLWKRYGPSHEKADLQAYYGISGADAMAVILDNEVLEGGGRLLDGEPYLSYPVVREQINSRFYWDSNEEILLYTLPTGNVEAEPDSREYTELSETFTEETDILRQVDGEAYISLAFVQKYTNIDYTVYTGPNRVMIISDWGDTQQAALRRDTQVRYQAGVKSPVLRDVARGETVTVIEPLDDWEKVRTSDGMIGYVRRNTLDREETVHLTRDFEEPVYESITRDHLINMAWHNVTNEVANTQLEEAISQAEGLNVISPTWYSIGDLEGNLSSISSREYVELAHASNLEVWAAFRDFQGGTSTRDEVFQVLSYTSKRTRLIEQVIADALSVGVDGINLDFELISTECGPHYIQFVRELSVACRREGLVLSVDNYVPQPYNAHYDLAEQGVVADYVVMMGYDEHTNNSLEAGSVASYGFVEEGIRTMLEAVPADKLVVGIPFFTRLWTETPKTQEELAQQEGTEAADYPMNITSQAISMETAQASIAAAGAEITWDEDAQQNYAQWEDEEGTHKIWIEDGTSVEERLELIFTKNGLAGVAAWRLGYETPEIWSLIREYTQP